MRCSSARGVNTIALYQIERLPKRVYQTSASDFSVLFFRLGVSRSLRSLPRVRPSIHPRIKYDVDIEMNTPNAARASCIVRRASHKGGAVCPYYRVCRI